MKSRGNKIFPVKLSRGEGREERKEIGQTLGQSGREIKGAFLERRPRPVNKKRREIRNDAVRDFRREEKSFLKNVSLNIWRRGRGRGEGGRMQPRNNCFRFERCRPPSSRCIALVRARRINIHAIRKEATYYVHRCRVLLYCSAVRSYLACIIEGPPVATSISKWPS